MYDSEIMAKDLYNEKKDELEELPYLDFMQKNEEYNAQKQASSKHLVQKKCVKKLDKILAHHSECHKVPIYESLQRKKVKSNILQYDCFDQIIGKQSEGSVSSRMPPTTNNSADSKSGIYNVGFQNENEMLELQTFQPKKVQRVTQKLKHDIQNPYNGENKFLHSEILHVKNRNEIQGKACFKPGCISSQSSNAQSVRSNNGNNCNDYGSGHFSEMIIYNKYKYCYNPAFSISEQHIHRRDSERNLMMETYEDNNKQNSFQDVDHNIELEDFEKINCEILSKYRVRKSMTMCDARKIAKLPGILQPFEIEINKNEDKYSECSFQEGSNVPSEEKTRKCWAKRCWSTHTHSHAVTNKRNRASILHASVVPAKGIAAWELKQQRVKLKIKESCKEFFKKIHVWSSSLKVIEGHFGTGVVSYFIFLRWLFFLNLFTFLIFFGFIVLPQAIFPVLQSRKNITIAPKTGLSDRVDFSELPFMKQEYQESHNTYYAPVDGSNMPFKALDVLGRKSNIDDSYLKSLGSLLETYAVPNILDVTLHYRQSNLTNEERHNISSYCSSNYSTQLKLSTRKASVGAVIQDFLQGTGWMELTLMFTGFYQPADLIVSGTGISYNLPVAFLVVLLFLCIFCLIMMMSYASEGLREMLLTAESNVQKYSNTVFCGWDYCIEDAKTAVLKQNSIVQELKSNLAEARRLNERAKWTTLQKVKVYSIRSAVHIAVITALVGAGYIIYYVTNYQLQFARYQNVEEGFLALFVQFLPSVTITALNFIMPVIFMILIKYERYSSQGEINMSLVRTVFLRLSSVIILVSSFYRQVTCEPKNMCGEGLHQCKSPMCWMTYVGQQMYKLVIMDLFVVVGTTFLWEVPRNFLVQRFRCKITDLLGRQTFDIPSQVLGLVYSQTLCWLGVFYSPLLPAVCVIKVYILFYIKKFTLLVNCIPSNNPYRASRSNAIFMVVLMLSFFITIAVLGYSISEIQPSPGCSPFRHYDYMFDAVRDTMNTWSPQLSGFFRFIFSAAFGIPAIILLCLAIYYYSTVSAAHSHMAKVLKDQLILEGRDKQFLLSRLTDVARHKGL